MSSRLISPLKHLAALSLLGLFAGQTTRGAVEIDGTANPADGYAIDQVQTNTTNLSGNRNVLANLRSVQEGEILNIFLGGVIDGNAIILFIDSKEGGISKISPTQIAVVDPDNVDKELYINNLALDENNGMTFENGFLPDTAIRISGGGTGSGRQAFVEKYDLVAGTFKELGEIHAANFAAGSLTDDLISDMRAVWNGANPGTYGTFANGVEMAMSLQGLGITSSRTIKMMAVLVNGLSSSGTNQVLGPLPPNAPSIGSGINTVNFETMAGTQTISIPVTIAAQDSDSDGLADSVETHTGTYISAENTGTDPNNPDTDGDGYPDGAEVSGTSPLGFVSNPNIPNYDSMVVSLPDARTAAMTRASTSLTSQYQWTLNQAFTATQLGSFNFNFAAGASSGVRWGAAPAAGSVVRDGPALSGLVTASGIHRFTFDQASLTYTFSRVTFPDASLFLAAYDLAPGGDADGDGISNQDEFTRNTDPTNPDTDGDGTIDSADPQPLVFHIAGPAYSTWIAGYAPDQTDRSADPDHDGFTNLEEFLFGTSPIAPNDSLVKMQRLGANLELHWLERTTGEFYQLQQSPTLKAGSWTESPAVPANEDAQPPPPDNYIRRHATIPIDDARKFIRVSATE